MKRRILFVSLLALIFVCAFAISVSAAYTPAKEYNYYKDSVAEENLLYSITTKMDPSRSRFEMTVTEEGPGFPKFDDEGNPICWYAISDTKEADGTRNIVVKSALTLGGVGTVDANGAYTFGGGTVEGIEAKDVVSINFFTTGVTTLPEYVFKSTGADSSSLPHESEYTVIADGSKILFLYLPKTLTAFPTHMCYRSPVRVIEFEENRVSFNAITGGESIGSPFSFCGNLKAISIPEGIETINVRVFRENCSLKTIKFPSTMTRLENDVFWRSNGIETVHFGENMTYIGYLNVDAVKMKGQGLDIKYMYIPNTVNEENSKFDSYRGTGTNLFWNVDRNLVFFFVGTKDQAVAVSANTDKHFKNAITNNAITYSEYISNKEYYDTKITGHTLVYNTPSCIAFHDGEHIMAEQSNYKDAISPFTVDNVCTRELCGHSTEISYNAPLEFLGYSSKMDGDRICVGYRINKDSFNACGNIKFGFLAFVPDASAEETTFEPLNSDLTAASDKVVSKSVTPDMADKIDFIVRGFNESYYDLKIVMCAYIAYEDKVDYLCLDEQNELAQMEMATTFTYNFITEITPKE